MNLEKLIKAKKEALRFLGKVEDLENKYSGEGTKYLCGSKETGSVKRSSMDLTRSLADLRRPE